MYEYPYGDNQQLNLDWFLTEFKNLVAAWEAEKAGIEGALDEEIARAEEALADVFAARDAAAASATAAAASASSAGTSATAAGNSATAAAASATLANNKAAAAGLSEANAAQSASNASASETTASNAATAAAASETTASNAATAAAQSASDANASATAAAQSATAAAASAEEAEEIVQSIPPDYSELAAEVALLSNGVQITPTFTSNAYINLNRAYKHHRILVDCISETGTPLAIFVYYPTGSTQKIIRVGNVDFSRGVRCVYEIDRIGNLYSVHASVYYSDYTASTTYTNQVLLDMTLFIDDIYRIGMSYTDLPNDTVTYYAY